MAGLSVVVFDVGETLVDEAATYARWEAEGRTEGIPFCDQDLHADALDCLATLREGGFRLGAAGNMHTWHEDFLQDHVDFVGSSERWGVEKPAAGFFQAIVEQAGVPAADIAYVGDRVDNDVVPALAAGMTAVRVRRGAHAADDTPAGVPEIESLVELPDVLP
jgi:FMN phosphatase YigB (HAD superfamily)